VCIIGCAKYPTIPPPQKKRKEKRKIISPLDINGFINAMHVDLGRKWFFSLPYTNFFFPEGYDWVSLVCTDAFIDQVPLGLAQ